MKDKIELITKVIELVLAMFSVGGAVFSWINSKKVKKDVEYIKKFKAEILNRENIEEIAKVREEVSNIKGIIKSYFFKSSKISSTGRNFNKDVASIQQSLTIIKENRGIFKHSRKNHSDIIYSDVNNLVDEMINYKNDEEKLKRIMRETDIKIDNFLAILKELKNSKKFN